MSDFNAIKDGFEMKTSDQRDSNKMIKGGEKRRSQKPTWKVKTRVRIKKFLTSTFGGIPFAIIYGIFIYYYVSFLILEPYQILEPRNESLSIK